MIPAAIVIDLPTPISVNRIWRANKAGLKRVTGDLDNRAKGVLDWLQSRSVIVDDKYCERLLLEWGEAPTGCRVTVRPL